MSMVLTTVLWSFTAWDDFEDTWSSWLQSEVEDRLSGWNRAPQQVEFLAAGGGMQPLYFIDDSM
ncbi:MULTISPECIES: hypothetical protein [Levilactobacillus]|uniref:hypothetical protein n=1 Tax=Levilactobacillus TaxID=2767886 RepID=UPI00194E374A|nr:hypothetical protein [Levilactobacillus sp. 244-2]